MIDYSSLSLHQIYNIITIDRQLNPTSLTTSDVQDFIDPYRKDWQLIRDLHNIHISLNRKAKSKSKKCNRTLNRKSTFSAEQVLSTIINPH